MVKYTNAEKAPAGEASSSRRKRQRLPSIIEDEAEATGEEEEEVENGGGTASGNRNKDGDVMTTERLSGTLFDLDLLECPVCYHALTNPIFQCDNGHIACSSCCVKLRNKCPTCTLPIGNYRCRIMERVVESISVSCPNAKHGCTKKLSYGKALAHEKECSFVPCYCPAPNCDYTGVYKDLYGHYYALHGHYYALHTDSWNLFSCLDSTAAWLRISKKILVLQEYTQGPLVAIQCFKEPQGVYVTVNCIAPSAPRVGKFSYRLSYTMGDNTMTFESSEMNRIQKVSFQTPQKDFMLVPYYFLDQCTMLKMEIHIRRLEEVAEEEEEEGEGEDDEE